MMMMMTTTTMMMEKKKKKKKMWIVECMVGDVAIILSDLQGRLASGVAMHVDHAI